MLELEQCLNVTYIGVYFSIAVNGVNLINVRTSDSLTPTRLLTSVPQLLSDPEMITQSPDLKKSLTANADIENPYL